jgi:hypothetical protein
MARLVETGASLCDWFVGRVLVYPEDSVVLVKEDTYKYEIRMIKIQMSETKTSRFYVFGI